MKKLKQIPVVVFTGAGASCAEPISLPDMAGFFEKIMDKNRNPINKRITDKVFFRRIIGTIYQKNNHYDLEKIMNVLYGLSSSDVDENWKIIMHSSMENEIGRKYLQKNSKHINADIVREIFVFVNELREVTNEYAQNLAFEMEDIIREIYSVILPENITEVYAPFFESLVEINRKFNDATVIPFFTTNYDMSIDWFFQPTSLYNREPRYKWLKDRKLCMIDGFIDQEWQPKNFERVDENSEIGILFVAYHKLHGSLFWEESEGIVRRGSNIARDPLLQQKLMIKYPSNPKELEHDIYHYSQNALDSYLQRAKNLLVIGFSFRDTAIVQAFQYALNTNDNLKIHIVLPAISTDSGSRSEVEKFIERNANRVNHVEQSFGTQDCLNAIKTHCD
jgi:hypothetical protein